jgi:hypothetical protein
MGPGNAQSLGGLRATLESALEFGLDQRTVWETMIEVCSSAPLDAPVGELPDALAAALAARILEHERSVRR